jgi:hypothetical protein
MKQKIRYGYRLEKKLSESKSLKTYFSIKEVLIKKKELKKLIKKKTRKLLILLTSDLSLYADYIKNSNRQIIIFQLSDEGYNFSHANIYKNKNIKFIVRNYKIFPLNVLIKSLLRWPSVTVKWIYFYWFYNIKNSDLTINESLRHLRYIIFSIKILLRQIMFSWLIRKIEKKIIYAPLNEANFFKLIKNNKTKKKFTISFSGSLHSSERRRVYLVAKEIGFSNGYTEWGWNSKNSLSSNAYIKMFKNSNYSLCPTGHVNLETFRFYEIIRSGSLPIIPKETPFQPFNYYSKIYDVDPRIVVDLYTNFNIKNIIKSISVKDYYLILKNLVRSIELKNKKVKDFLNVHFI